MELESVGATGGERPVRLPHRNHSNTVKADTHAGRSGE